MNSINLNQNYVKNQNKYLIVNIKLNNHIGSICMKTTNKLSLINKNYNKNIYKMKRKILNHYVLFNLK